jgi:beta-mannosidase
VTNEVITELTQWTVAAFWPYTQMLGKSIELGQNFKNTTPWIQATVPGSIYADLFAAGIIDDPYFGQNSLKCEWVSNRWWTYKTRFDYPESIGADEQVELIFEGIDYSAHIYLNNEKIAVHKGMFVPKVINITEYLQNNRHCNIDVIFENAPEEMSQIGYTSQTKILKSRFSYKWDFCTRLVNVGLYGKVYLRKTSRMVLRNFHFKAYKPLSETSALLELDVEAYHPCDVVFDAGLECGISHGSASSGNMRIEAGINRIVISVPVENMMLWYPNGSGGQPLYALTVNARVGSETIGLLKSAVGFCQKEFVRNENAAEDSLDYTFVVNGRKTYINGVNLTPLDMMYGCVNYARYDELLMKLKKANINLVRVWGGGVIETREFYDLCDKYGIMVWQEFIQSSSGIESTPSIHENFIRELAASAEHAVKVKRNNVSHTIWSGGNELTDQNGVPSTFEDENIRMLKRLVDLYDEGKYMLPTSASGPISFADYTQPGRNHDVHGPWKFLGAEEHYNFYNKIDSQFHSEFGCDSLSNYESIKKILSLENHYPMNMSENYDWRHHGEWWDTFQRDSEIFGDIDDLEVFCKLSQFIQAEALRYALEANRRRAFQNSGSIVWQGNEPYPNVSCTSLIDYFQRPKLALWAVRNAFSSVQATLQYDSFIVERGQPVRAKVYVTNDHEETGLLVCCSLSDETGKVVDLVEFYGRIGEGRSLRIGEIVYTPSADAQCIRITLTTKTTQKTAQNSILFLIKDPGGFCSKELVCAFYDDIQTEEFIHEN